MSTEVTQQIKDKIDIVDLIGSYVKLQKAGANYRARCPFHNEKSASFHVSSERGIWHCFGCGVGGDIFSFIQQIEGVEFPEALRQLAQRAGVKLEEYSQSDFKQNSDIKNTLFNIIDASAKFFEKQLWQSNSGTLALQYLKDRGMTDETIKKFRLGYAPQSWDGLSNYLSDNFSQDEIIKSGVAIKRNSGSGFYDRFRSRIMFPIFNVNGQAVGFSGRIFHPPDFVPTNDQEEAKYINTPQTEIYDKSRILYGLDKAKLNIRSRKRCLVVEGNVDVIMSHQAGADFAIATCGTALTESHLDMIKRYADQIDLCFDADNAGINATEKAIQLCLSKGLKIHALVIEDSAIKDPADFVQKYGTKWLDVVLNSKPFLEYIYEIYKNKFNLKDPQGKHNFCSKILPYVGLIQNRIEKTSWISRVSLATRLSEQVIAEEISKLNLSPLHNQQISQSQNIKSNIKLSKNILDSYEESLLGIVLIKPELASGILDKNLEISQLARSFIATIIEIMTKNNADIVFELKSKIVNSNYPQADLLSSYLDMVYIKSQELWYEFSVEALKSQIDIILKKIQNKSLNNKLRELQLDIRLAEQENDRARLSQLLSEFSLISQKLNQI